MIESANNRLLIIGRSILERKEQLESEQIFANAAARADEYSRGGFLHLTIDRVRNGRFISGMWRAWRVFRPTVIIARVFRVIFIALTYVERSAALIAAGAITMMILPIVAVVAVATSATNVCRMRRVYSLLRRCEDSVRGVVVVFGESDLKRIKALSCGRAAVTISPRREAHSCAKIEGGLFSGDERFFFYLRRRARRDRISLWVIY